jgi:glutamate racemase
MSKIGVFDSGYGGLTVLKELKAALPQFDFVYLGDNARAPYGDRSFDVVHEYTWQCVKWLFEKDCDLVILACNTASAKALRVIQQTDLPNYNLNASKPKRVLGVIRPTTEIVGNITKTNKIGIVGTLGTVKSESYVIEIDKFFPQVKVYQEACPIWVHLIENELLGLEGTDYFVKYHLNRLFSQDSDIDTLILACTHYPLLLDSIEKVVPKHVKVMAQGEIVAWSLAKYLERHTEFALNLSQQSTVQFYTSEVYKNFNALATVFYGSTVVSKHADIT